MNRAEIRKKTRAAANNLVAEKGYVSPVDLFIKMKVISPQNYQDWRVGRIACLERVTTGGLGKLNTILKELRDYARSQGWYPSKTVYNKWGKGRKIRLRFSKSGRPNLEEIYSTHYVKKGLIN